MIFRNSFFVSVLALMNESDLYGCRYQEILKIYTIDIYTILYTAYYIISTH